MIAMSVASLITYTISKPDVNHTPIWHPFKLNSNITLEALVMDGYRCFGTPCGQPQFFKTIGDTTIQYDVGQINCDLDGGHDNYQLIGYGLGELDPSIEVKNQNSETYRDTLLSDSEIHDQEVEMWKDRHAINPYFPYDINEVRDCYQGINWRIYTIKLQGIDSLAIVDFVKRNGGYFSAFEDWNAKDGGSFLVNHYKSDLFFICFISPKEFSIIRSIPHLDQSRELLERKREEKSANYYQEQK